MAERNSDSNTTLQNETFVDVKQIEKMGQDVMGTVQYLRELLEAKSDALKACQGAMEEDYEKKEQALLEREKKITDRKTEMEERDKLISERESSITEQQFILSQKEQLIVSQQKEWKDRIDGLNSVCSSMTELITQLDAEVQKAANEEVDLLSRYGLSASNQANKAVEHYQKLCSNLNPQKVDEEEPSLFEQSQPEPIPQSTEEPSLFDQIEEGEMAGA